MLSARAWRKCKKSKEVGSFGKGGKLTKKHRAVQLLTFLFVKKDPNTQKDRTDVGLARHTSQKGHSLYRECLHI